MRNIIIVAGLVLACVSAAAAQGRNSPGDRALGSELNRDKAETRIDRLRQDQKQKEERPAAARSNAKAIGTTTQQQQPR